LPLRAAEYWVAPFDYDGCIDSLTTNTPAYPLCFSTSGVQQIIDTNPKDPGGAEVKIHFFPGTYETDTLYLRRGTNPNRQLILQAYDANQPPVLKFKVPTNGTPFWGPISETWLLHAPYGDSGDLAYFEAENLTLDGNWPAWAAANTHASPANSFVHESSRERGFKLGALFARAREGKVSGVRIRNCGALGVTPWPWWIGPGTECFPLYIEGTQWSQDAWTIEDCEVSDFYSVHGGYCTAIMVTAKGNPPNENARVATVRRCRVYGSNLEVGLGTAASSGVRFTDNVLVGVDRGFSCDTRPIRYVDLTRNVFLDVNLMANIGTPDQGPGPTAFSDFLLAHNAVRLESVPLYQDYRNYAWQAVNLGGFTNWMPVSSATLAAGRFATGFCAGVLVGGADHIRFQTNRFTTRHVSGFFEPDPTNTALAQWRAFWMPAYSPVTGRECYHGTNLTVSDVRLSSSAMDFVNTVLLTNPTNDVYYAQQTLTVTNFLPAGRIERVRAEYLTNGDSITLSQVWEIRVTQPVLQSGQVRVKARLVAHRPTADTYVETNPEDLQDLLLSVRTGPNTNVMNWIGTVTNGVVTFTYNTNGLSGRDEIVVDWGDARTVVEVFHGQTVRFERIADVADDRRLNPGLLRLRRSDPSGALTVTLAPLTPNDRPDLRLALPGSGGDYHLHTNLVSNTNQWAYKAPNANGTWDLVFPAGWREILVRVAPVNNAANRHTIESEMAAFRLLPGANYAVAPPGPWTTPGPTNHSVAVTLWDGPKYWMYDLLAYYYFECGDSSGQGLTDLAMEEAPQVLEEETFNPAGLVGAPAEDAETVLDGPTPPGWIRTRTGEWIALEEAAFDSSAGETIEPEDAAPGGLESSGEALGLNSTICYLSGWGNTAYGINNQRFDTNSQPPVIPPVIAGSAFFNNSSYQQLPQPYFQLAGSWQAPNYSDFRAVSTPWNYGLLRDVNRDGNLAGEIDSRACYVEGTNVYYLRGFQTNVPYASAYALSDGGYAAGWARTNSVNRAALWDVLDLNQTPINLDPNNPTRPGAAFGVNANGWVVGRVQRTKDGVNVWRAFRWYGTLNELELPSVSDPNIILYHNVANDLSASAHAVGFTDAMIVRGTTTNVQTRAAVGGRGPTGRRCWGRWAGPTPTPGAGPAAARRWA